MRPKKSKERYTQEEILTLSDVEIVKNWTKLASLIRAYEKLEWDDAKDKALELRAEGGAFNYINTVRKYPDGHILEIEKPETVFLPKKQAKVKAVQPVLKTELTIYEKNYNRLLLIVPDLEEKLAHLDFHKSGDELYGKSHSSGFMDFNFELTHVNDSGYFFAMSHYYKQNGDMVADPDMLVLLNLQNRTLEALYFQNAFYFREVYDDVYNRKLVNTKEKESQNKFLSQWLRNLKEQGHKIEWRVEESEAFTSIIVDEHKKKAVEKHAEKSTKKESDSIEELPIIDKVDPIPIAPEIEKVEVIEPSKTNKMTLEFSEQQTKKLSSVLVFQRGGSIEQSTLKATELIESGKAVDYLLDAFEQLKSHRLESLMQANYHKLISLIPNVVNGLDTPIKSLSLISKKSEIKTLYVLSDAVEKGNTKQFAVYESGGNSTTEGTFLVGVRKGEEQAWVEVFSEKFYNQSDYMDEHQEVLSDERYLANRAFAKWLDYLVSKKFEAVWKEKEEIESTTTEADFDSEGVLIEPSETKKSEVEPTVSKSDKVNAKIPDFEAGKVKLTKQHKEHGLTQKEINWINKHKQGLTIMPRTKIMVNTTKSVPMDKAKKAQRPGFRISRTGKLYYEGRSNRSDRTDQGL